MTDEKRGSARQRVLKGAFIVITEKQPKIECIVKNISFALLVGGVRRHCHVQWKSGTKIGVKFE
jgi:hypothetical protein